jgi:hypothetical protein
MTDDERHDEVTRLLREQGPVQAPADLRGEVMRRVVSEPRTDRQVRRPLLVLLAASLMTIAIVAGISRIDGGGVGSGADVGAEGRAATDAGGGGATAQMFGSGAETAPSDLVAVQKAPRRQALRLAAVYGAATAGIEGQAGQLDSGIVFLYVPASKVNAVRQKLLSVTTAKQNTRFVEVRIYRVPG